ncbi:uncharacterized protein LOC124125294 isoform X1 [Haliotis rufescens]|uniref:uncharacterized protein LOC124125294 isoform X1 n=1 Tax=Haliotis rufescens TaxID=6454 RepID=UPI001EB00063|nr:uncharacterized protein LOC124125294 isoform X1 [Haliotis rufescens]
MPFKGFFKLFGFKKNKDTAKTPRTHPYDEVKEEDLKPNQTPPKRRPREYDEIEIDDDASGPTMVSEISAKPETKTLNYIEVEVQQQNPDADVRRAAPSTQYTTIDVAATSAASGRKISLSE